MLKFRLLRIPVEVHFSHLAIAGLMSLLMLSSTRQAEGWPFAGLAAKDTPTQVAVVALWLFIISFSVLFHEMGHALASKAFGYAPSIHLIGLGGLTQPNPNETIPWHREVILTLAGPFAGLSLGFFAGAVALLLKTVHRDHGPLAYLTWSLFAANLFWALLNLIPVQPLDGGRIAIAVLMRLYGRAGFYYAQVLALCLGGLACAISLAAKQPFVVALLGMYLFRTVAAIRAYHRGELPPPEGHHPFERAFAAAQVAYQEGRYPEAKQVVQQLLQVEMQPTLRSQVHLLGGWLSLKEGEGRAALDHFSMAQGVDVPAIAQAAAFSLVGDDYRALPLWEQAARATTNATVSHEYAATLIRLGRVDDARRLPNVDLALAYEAAERVAFVRKDFASAAQWAQGALDTQPTAQRAYETACCWAQAQKPDDALRLLERARQLGFRDAARADSDADLAPLRTHPGYAAWLTSLSDGLTKR